MLAFRLSSTIGLRKPLPLIKLVVEKGESDAADSIEPSERWTQQAFFHKESAVYDVDACIFRRSAHWRTMFSSIVFIAIEYIRPTNG